MFTLGRIIRRDSEYNFPFSGHPDEEVQTNVATLHLEQGPGGRPRMKHQKGHQTLFMLKNIIQ